MTAAALSDESRREVKRIVLVSRLAGVLIAIALAAGSFAIHRGSLGSLESIAQFASIVIGLGSFVAISTLTRMGHTRILEKSLDEVGTLTDRLRDLADRDPLTGLYNMRAFYEALGAAITRAEATGAEVSVIVADLDNFKTINDSFGHQFGDKVLLATGEAFAAGGGSTATAARLGGDEFALLLPGLSRGEAVEIGRGIEARLREVKIEAHQPAMLGSFGIGTYPGDGRTAQLLFAAADGRMYSEKHSRKSESLSALSRASWRVFVRDGRALMPGQTPEQILREIAAAAREEFALTACIIKLDAASRGVATAVAAADDPELEPILARMAERGALDAAAIAAEMPADAWLVGQPIGGVAEGGGLVLLAGRPTTSFRPDASVVVALADLIRNVVAEGREMDDRRDVARAA
jgi:diguanylate cyclase (GGDEF)-like protein